MRIQRRLTLVILLAGGLLAAMDAAKVVRQQSRQNAPVAAPLAKEELAIPQTAQAPVAVSLQSPDGGR